MNTTILSGNTIVRKKSRIWTRDFLLLWQGQFVSAIGDAAYEIALGFWVLYTTGSTGMMGLLMASTMLPRVLLSPFAGIWVDRLDRKWLLVLMDTARGVAVLLVGVTAFKGHLELWMAFAAGLVIGAGGAFFNPSIGSILPDLVEKDQLVKANSFFSMIRAGSGVFGNSAGGFLLTALGAPLMFVLNGLSYLFSAATELFIRVPVVKHKAGEWKFWLDMKEGLRFAWSSPGLRFFMGAAAVVNFVAMIGFVLILPLFEQVPNLGPTRYGFLLASLTVGMLIGTIFTAGAKLPQQKFVPTLLVSLLGCSFLCGFLPLFGTFYPMAVFILVGGFFNGIVNILLQSIIQMTVPQHMRGKIMGLLEALTGGLTPFGMAVGGILGEFLPLRIVISVSFLSVGLLCIPLGFSKGLQSFVRAAGSDNEIAQGTTQNEITQSG